jgi:hypothetical protein
LPTAKVEDFTMIRGGGIERLTHLRPSYVNSFLILGMLFSFFDCFPPVARGSQETGSEWIRPETAGKLIWGVKGGIVFSVWPTGIQKEGLGGPRGLFRIGYERDGAMALVNFVAVEPIVGNKRGFSELELSSVVDEDMPTRLRRGKFIWPSSEHPPQAVDNRPGTIEDMRSLLSPGWLTCPSTGVEQLNVAFDVEKFNNGAHPWIVASIRSDQPREVIFRIHAAPDSAPMRSCILTATMGNYIRARHLWLRDRLVYTKTLWPNPVAAGVGPVGFTRPEFFEETSMLRLRDGSLIVLVTTDEDDPSKVMAKPSHWRYRGRKVTQYWRAHPHQEHPLRIRVNGRFTYWMSRSPIPNGVAYENFELVQDYFDGQGFIFGVTELSPTQFDLTTEPPVHP